LTIDCSVISPIGLNSLNPGLKVECEVVDCFFNLLEACFSIQRLSCRTATYLIRLFQTDITEALKNQLLEQIQYESVYVEYLPGKYGIDWNSTTGHLIIPLPYAEHYTCGVVNFATQSVSYFNSKGGNGAYNFWVEKLRWYLNYYLPWSVSSIANITAGLSSKDLNL